MTSILSWPFFYGLMALSMLLANMKEEPAILSFLSKLKGLLDK